MYTKVAYSRAGVASTVWPEPPLDPRVVTRRLTARTTRPPDGIRRGSPGPCRRQARLEPRPRNPPLRHVMHRTGDVAAHAERVDRRGRDRTDRLLRAEDRTPQSRG